MAAHRRVLTFGVAGRRLAIEVAAVREVVATPALTRVPRAPPALAGLGSLRGRVTPIVSLAAALGEAEARMGGRVIVLDRPDPVGLVVDDVSDMHDVEIGPDGQSRTTGAGDPVRLLEPEAVLEATFALAARAPPRAPSDAPRLAEGVGAAGPSEHLAWLAFEVAAQVYALPLDEVREVTSLPARVVSLPQVGGAAIGVMRLRDGLLPLVSARALLGLMGADRPAAPVVVAAVGGQPLGLVVDAARAIVRIAPDRIGPAPSVLDRGPGEARIAALARTPDGIVSILSAARILREETVARLLAEPGAGARREVASPAREEPMHQFVLFRVGEESYGLPIAAIDEVLDLPSRVTRVPRAPAFVLGVMSRRGTVLPLIDQRRRFGVASAAPGEGGRRVIVTRVGETAVGFVVDAVEGVARLPDEALTSAPELAAGDAAIFDRVARLGPDGRLALLLEPRELLDRAERDVVAALAATPGAPAGEIS